ncbi:lysine-specific demethylase JMJ31 isoform X2 [Solanum dulcamara]|uniref:lysine-specific demethylase JMJ31 isoform X2 n=1 Tax=Solanum dulcamara TaxID=45834 RepID=UPI0024858958|nr:lysine-specific demethylase JMJ31 isoform X2 [Solanum dulcamara]
MVEENLRIHTFTEIPSPEIFSSQIEPKNVPAVIKGCIKNWKAFSKWNPSDGGLIYLQECVGSVAVEAMLSRSAPVFYGDIRSHERVPLSFSTFIRYCLGLLKNRDGRQDDFLESQKHSLAVSDTEQTDLLFGEVPQQFYLAQVPILNFEKKEHMQLECLGEDIQTPVPLETKSLSSVNLWMNSMKARSSTHYDPHHNLLCIVSGCKEVTLWPPSATPYLYPLPLYGEASNHSSVTLEEPDLSVYPRAAFLNGFSQKVVLHAGDALFIPEGWFHQVDSEVLTIAVNFWWRSMTISGMLDHMDAYYLRRILKRLTDKEMNKMLHSPSSSMDKTMTCTTSQPNNAYRDHGHQGISTNCGNRSSKDEVYSKVTLQDLEPCASQSLNELISLVHDRLNPSKLTESTNNSSAGENDETNKRKEDSCSTNDDPVANLILTLHPLRIHSVFLAMANNFPRTLEALVLHALTPVGSEILTRKFEEMDQLISGEDQNQFYQIFYGVFDDQSAAMDVLLNGKELFARQAFENVLDQYLGNNPDGPKQQTK